MKISNLVPSQRIGTCQELSPKFAGGLGDWLNDAIIDRFQKGHHPLNSDPWLESQHNPLILPP